MASINNVITATLIPAGMTAGYVGMNSVCVVTSDQTVLTSAERYRAYPDPQSVAEDYGSASAVSQYANAFFGTTPNSVQAGGRFIVGYHRAATETVAATAAVLRGAQVAEVATVDALQAITDGSFNITINGVVENITLLDFSTVTTLSEAAAVIDAKLTGGTATVSNSRIIITSDTTGALSTITLATAGASGTFVGELLGLASGTGAVLTQGADADSLAPETKVEALDAIKAQIEFKGVCFIDQMLDAEVPLIAAWAQANATLVYNVFSGSDYLAVSDTNPVWTVKRAGQSNFRMLYSKSGNRQLAVSYMARAHVVNFGAENSALTMHLKELAVPSEAYSQTELDSAKRVGLDVYTSIKDVNVVLTSGANDFMDNRYNLISFVDAVQTDAFNLLKTAGTKVPQTIPGVNALTDTVEKTCTRYVRAAFIAPGTWLSANTFGDVATFKRNIEQFGYYVLAAPLSQQSQADRDARKSPVIQVAIKNAGAIHSVDCVINFER